MSNQTYYTLVFQPGKGEVNRRSMEVTTGQALGELPIPRRQGYTFDGWYTAPEGKGQKIVPGDIPDFGDDTVLYAHWRKMRKAAKKKSMYRTQKNAAIALAVSFALLIVVLIGVNALVDILSYTEEVRIVAEDGTVETISTKYYVKKIDGVYHLCHLNGSFPNFTFEPLPQDADGYFVTDHDSLIQVDPKTGACKVYAVVETEGTEVVGYSGRVMLFRQLTYDASSKLGQKPQNRIDKTGGLATLHQLCQFYGFVHCCAVRHLVQKQNLVRTQLQNLQQRQLQMIRLLAAVGTNIEIQ
jgi:uncharacterized repeat protein (TIGR02543 family)